MISHVLPLYHIQLFVPVFLRKNSTIHKPKRVGYIAVSSTNAIPVSVTVLVLVPEMNQPAATVQF